jgi:rare lipoprotein A
MNKLVIGCAVAGLLTLSPTSNARNPAAHRPRPLSSHTMPRAEIGWASWYGVEHQDQPTASGESFDMDKLTGAHRKLPLGTVVRVTNLRNGRTTRLRINDRGPGPAKRMIDLSWAAAKRLGFLKQGLTPVQVQVVSYPQAYLAQVAQSHPAQFN